MRRARAATTRSASTFELGMPFVWNACVCRLAGRERVKEREGDVACVSVDVRAQTCAERRVRGLRESRRSRTLVLLSRPSCRSRVYETEAAKQNEYDASAARAL